MYKIAVMGDYDSIYGFAALGLTVCPAEDPQEGARILKDLAAKDTAVVYITEALASQMKEVIESYDESLLPAVIPIPGISGNNGFGIAQVKKSVERAVGSDIIFKQD